MKKFLSILLAVILAFSAFTMVSFAEETEITEAVTEASTETPDAPTDTPDKPTDIKDSMFYKWATNHNWNSLNDVEFSGKITGRADNGLITAELWIKNGKAAFEMPLEAGEYILNSKLILSIKGGSAKYYLSDFPFFYFSINPRLILSNFRTLCVSLPFQEDSDLVLESAYEEDGYYVEEIRNTEWGTTNYYYFKDGELVRTESYQYGTLLEKIEDISYEVSDKDVRGPILALNLTPLIFFLGLFGLI